MAKYINGVEIKIQAKKTESSDIRKILKEAALANPNIKSVIDIGTDRIFMDTELAVSQQLINNVVKEKGLKESQFVLRLKKLLV